MSSSSSIQEGGTMPLSSSSSSELNNNDTSNYRVQTIVFIRHGVAIHNTTYPNGQQRNYLDPALLDPPLILDGKIRAIHAGSAVQEWFINKQRNEKNTTNNDNTSSSSSSSSQQQQQQQNGIELIVTSPLTRCIQTTTLGFLRGDTYNDENNTTTTTNNNNEPIPIICNENVREAFGVYYPDKRRNKSLLMKYWPAVQFDDSMFEEDIAWRSNVRETLSDVDARIQHFLQWIVQRKETNIVVISHGVWMETLFRNYASADFNKNGKRINNLDCYACQLISDNSNNNNDNQFVRIDSLELISQQYAI